MKSGYTNFSNGDGIGCRCTAPAVIKSKISRVISPVHATHVVQAYVPSAMTGSREAVGESSQPKVALEHQDAPALQLRHQAGDWRGRPCRNR